MSRPAPKSQFVPGTLLAMRLPLLAPSLLVLLLAVSPCFEAQEIHSLPGLSFTPNFRHYSGFFRVSDSHFLHYWFVESQRDPAKDPLIFWFNGGPGCSSLDGLLNEMGPYVANEDGKSLRANPNAWNRFASVVYIEAPAGVGYSYSADGNITTNDDLTSTENYEGLKQFYKTFPAFRNHSTYIMGESYGGVYVPTLAARVIDGQKDFAINFKGLALGNGYVNEKLNLDTSVRFAYAHGIVDEKVWNTLERDCCKGCIDGCDLSVLTGHCSDLAQDIFLFMWSGGLNVYDLYRDCDPNPSVNGARARALLKGLSPIGDLLETTLQPPNSTPKREKTLLDLARKSRFLYGDAPCLNDSDVITYMNDLKVRNALNIPFNLPKWDICSDKVTTTYQKQYGDMSPFIKKILGAHVRVLLYYGDTDMACNFMMGQQFVDRLGLRRKLGKTPWKFEKQIAGFKTLFDGLTFITVRGAGHMAPQWRAPQMAYVIEQFLLNHPI